MSSKSKQPSAKSAPVAGKVIKSGKQLVAAAAAPTPPPAAPVTPAPVVAKRAIVKNPAAVNAPAAAKLTWLVTANPKRPGSAAHTRASAYWGQPTVGAYLAAGGQRVDLAWDAAHGFFEIVLP